MTDPAASVLSHFDANGQAHMVDVSAKAETHRVAKATGTISMRPETLALIASGTAKKGDVLGVARIAAIQGAKRTSELIPLCHPLAITRIAVDFEVSVRPKRGALHRAGRNAGAHRRGDGGLDGRAGRLADGLRHVQGGRPWNADRRRLRSGESRAASQELGA